MTARGYDFRDPCKILEERQDDRAREIAELIFKLPEAMWEDKLSLMRPEWRQAVEPHLNAKKQQRAVKVVAG